MRTVTFKTVFENIVRRMEKDPATAALTTAQEARIVALINTRVREGWQYAMWPELVLAEERAFRTTWLSTTTFAAGNECYYSVTDKYYISLQNSNTNHLPSETGSLWWSEVTSLNKYLPWTPLDSYPIGTVVRISKSDPYRYADTRYDYTFEIHNSGVQVTETCGNKLWLTHRLRPNQFTRVAWSATPATAYAVGDLVYLDSTGECYQATVSNGVEQWSKIDFPEFLQDFVEAAVFADDLKEDGQKERATLWEGLAYQSLRNEYEVQFKQQGLL